MDQEAEDAEGTSIFDSSIQKRNVIVCLVLSLVAVIVVVISVILATACNRSVGGFFDRGNGEISIHFKRVTFSPRPDYQDKVEKAGLTYHDEPCLIWSKCEE